MRNDFLRLAVSGFFCFYCWGFSRSRLADLVAFALLMQQKEWLAASRLRECLNLIREANCGFRAYAKFPRNGWFASGPRGRILSGGQGGLFSPF